MSLARGKCILMTQHKVAPPMLWFLVPVRHPATVRDWGAVKAVMALTFRSIAAQDHPDWACIIAADEAADLPDPPAPAAGRFHVVRTALPPAVIPRKGWRNRTPFYHAIRADKAARLRAAYLAAGPEGHVMVTDFDDLVSRRLAGLAAAAPEASGWYFDQGLLWAGGGWVMDYPRRFHRYCGSSHILHQRHLAPIRQGRDAGDDLALHFLGSHVVAHDRLAAEGDPLAPLPFCGAVYRIGHGGATSRQSFAREVAKGRTPWGMLRRLGRLRPRPEGFAAEFMGGA